MVTLPARLGGRYRVQERVGQGAIAEVVRARDDATDAEVALKVLYPALRDSPIVVERFRREVDFVRQIRDPHVLAIHDVVDADGFLFLVMDYHPGGDLADQLARRGPLSTDALAKLAGQLCAALQAAHRAGIVHRDVKPSNILVGPGPALDVRLCDFGLARSAAGTGLTSSAAVLGTPEYMAPEVIAEGHADPRSDVYSLGVVLFEAATGQVPFAADSPYQLMRLHLEGEVPSPRAVAPQLPRAMEAAIMRALAKDPLDRFASAAQLAEAFTGAAPPARPALVPTAGAGAVCLACGGWLIDSLRVCADCGHGSLTLEYEPRGLGVLVTGPGLAGDKIEARAHVVLHRLMTEVPAHDLADDGLPAGAPRLPFYVARGLTPASAENLLGRVQALGLQARITTGWLFAPAEMRVKVRKIIRRFTAGIGIGYWSFQMTRPLLDGLDLPLPSYVLYAGLVGVLLLVGTGLGIRSARPLLSRPATGGDPRLPQTLARTVARIESRQDRRLLGRICDRLRALASTPLGSETPALTRYALELADRLCRIEAAHRASDEANEAVDAAQPGLRRMERAHVLVRTRLLRVLAELEALGAAELMGQGEAARAPLSRARQLAQDWSFDLEAERELAGLLAPQPGTST
jgi:tRNA A-37 threonylcarbamoyl transferase component Bud32